MSAPLYFLPHATAGEVAPGGRLNRRLLKERGLDGVFADVEGPQIDCSLNALAGRGPDNLPGVILCALPPGGSEPPRRLGYYPQEQVWHPCWGGGWRVEGGGTDPSGVGFLSDTQHSTLNTQLFSVPRPSTLHPPLFIGLDTASPPTPADLVRKQLYRGHRVCLADGNEWEVPVLRSPRGTTSLPRSMAWDAAGTFELRIKREYLEAWDASAETMRLFYEPDRERTIDLEEACLRGLAALAINYRIGRAEQSLLGLIDSTNWESVLLASVDGPTVLAYIAAEKKKQRLSADPRLAEFLAWRAGLVPGYRPSRGELLIAGLIDDPPPFTLILNRP